jgi:hypothetical protein
LPISWTARQPSPGTVDFFLRVPGDADDDGVLSASDVQQVLSAGRYLSDQPATWSQGDWTGDGRFDQRDIVLALQKGQFPPAPLAAIRGMAHNQGQPASLLAKDGPATTGKDDGLDALDEGFATLFGGT